MIFFLYLYLSMGSVCWLTAWAFNRSLGATYTVEEWLYGALGIFIWPILLYIVATSERVDDRYTKLIKENQELTRKGLDLCNQNGQLMMEIHDLKRARAREVANARIQAFEEALLMANARRKRHHNSLNESLRLRIKSLKESL